MWIIQEPKKVALWNKRHFEEKNGECVACLKYSVLIFVEKIYIKCNIWRVAVRPSYIQDARFLKVKLHMAITMVAKRHSQNLKIRISLTEERAVGVRGRIIIHGWIFNVKSSYGRTVYETKLKLNSVALVRERTIPTERPPPVGEVSANFCG